MSGSYTVTVTNAAGCSSSATTNVIVNDCVGMDENNVKAINIYPNPTTGIIDISTSVNGLQFVSICNILGEEEFSKEFKFVSDTPIKIDLRGLPAGMYFLKIGDFTERIIKF